MKVLVIGSGGREHALCWKIAKSHKVSKTYCAPGNGGTSLVAENVNIKANDIDGLLQFAMENKIDLTIVGPEEPLVLGIVDRFEENGLRIFGPNKNSAQLEGSKEFSKQFMEKYNIPTAKYRSFVDYEKAVTGLEEFTFPLVIKADGLCLGKGVYICNDRQDAIDALEETLKDNKFGKEGSTVVIEEFLDGVEASLLCLVSGDKIIPMESAVDYKKIYDGDKGPNTGGIGCYSPSPLIDGKLDKIIKERVLSPIENGLKSDNLEFKGILFIGLMIVGDIPYVLEFNARFGDPETEVLMPRLKSDLIDILVKTLDETLEHKDVIWDERPSLALVTTSKGYPSECITGFEISGLDSLDEDIIVFHNGTRFENEKLLSNGGRVLSLTTLGNTLEEAREKIYSNIEKAKYDGMYYRKDIGLR